MLCASQPLRLLLNYCPRQTTASLLPSLWTWFMAPLLLLSIAALCQRPYFKTHSCSLVWPAMARLLPYLSALWLQPFGRQPGHFMLKHTFQFWAGASLLFICARDQKSKGILLCIQSNCLKIEGILQVHSCVTSCGSPEPKKVPFWVYPIK